MKAHEILSQCARLKLEKEKEYGDTQIKFGKVLDEIFPDGIPNQDPERLGILFMIIHKLLRYCHNYNTPHNDSITDMIVYGAMLAELDSVLLPTTIKIPEPVLLK